MAKSSYCLLCFLLSLTMLAECGLSARVLNKQIGSVMVSNNAYDMHYLTSVRYEDGRVVTDPDYNNLPYLSSYTLQVQEGAKLVSSQWVFITFHLAPILSACKIKIYCTLILSILQCVKV